MSWFESVLIGVLRTWTSDQCSFFEMSNLIAELFEEMYSLSEGYIF